MGLSPLHISVVAKNGRGREEYRNVPVGEPAKVDHVEISLIYIRIDIQIVIRNYTLVLIYWMSFVLVCKECNRYTITEMGDGLFNAILRCPDLVTI